MSVPFVYDAGALIALDNADRAMWARHHLALEDGRDIHVPATVVAQAWRDAQRQVRLGQVLAACVVDPVDLTSAKAAGILCGRAGRADVVDASVVVLAASLGAIVWTSDPSDIRVLVEASAAKPAPVIRVV